MINNLSLLKRFLNPKYILIIIIVIVSIGIYLNTLPNEFVYDDEFQILQNPWIKDIQYIPSIFFSNMWAFKGEGITNYYRPLLHIVYMMDYYTFGLKPWGFHLTNIFFHAAVSMLLFLIALMLLNKMPSQQKSHPLPDAYSLIPAFIAALLFATHPIHAETVAVGGLEPLFTFFYLLSFYFYIKTDKLWVKRYILSLLFFFLSTLCKETALTLPVILIIYDYSFFHSKLNTLYSKLKGYLPYFIVAGIYFILRTYALGGFAPLKRHPELSNYQYIINIFPLFIQYLEKLVLPINLNAYYVLHPILSVFEWNGMISIILTIVFIFGVYFLFRTDKLVFFSLLLIVIPILPVLYIPVLGENTFAERYLYLPSVGFAILISILIERIFHFITIRQPVFYVIVSLLIVVITFYSAQTMGRNYIWKDNYTLWSDTVEKSPDGAEPHNNLGVIYQNKGLIDKSMEHYQIALRLNPDFPEVYNNMGTIYSDKGLIDKAMEHYLIALRLKPDYTEAYYNLGNVYFDKGLIDKAVEHFQTVLRLKPDFPDANYNLGIIYSSLGQLDMAIREFSVAIQLTPDDTEAHYNLGVAYKDKGLFDKAMEHFQTAIKLRPDYPEAQDDIRRILEERNTIP